MNSQYEVLSPWAEVDPISLRGISPRLNDMTGKKIGLFFNNKRAARPIQDIVEKKLREGFPSLEFSHFLRTPNLSVLDTKNRAEFEDWVKGVDAVILSVAD